MGDIFLFFASDAAGGGWALFVLVTAFAGVSMGAVGVGGVVIVPAAIAFLAEPPRVAVASTIPGYIATAAVGTWTYRSVLTSDKAVGRFAAVAAGGAGAGGLLAALALHALPSRAIAIGVATFALAYGLKALVGLACESLRPANKDQQEEEEEQQQQQQEEEEGDGVASGTELVDVVRAPIALHEEDVDLEVATTTTGDSDSDSASAVSKGSSSSIDSVGWWGWWREQLRSALLGVVVGFGSALTGTSGPLLFMPLALLVAT